MNPDESSPSPLKRRFKLPKADQIEQAIASFSLTEKVVFFILAVVFTTSVLYLVWKVNEAFLVEVPAYGGSLSEGVIGDPRYINPLLPITPSGTDLSSLIYSGLMKATPSGALVPDLAKSYTISSDGLTYTFVLKDNLTFQDGTPLTTDDIVFTIETAENADLKSPKAPNWNGVTVNKIDDKTIQFVLRKPYAPFLQNTTLGILPKHLWENISADEFAFSNYNIQPIGSGPYEIKSIKRDSDGLPEYYELTPFSNYAGGKAYLSDLIIRFYADEDDLVAAYDQGLVQSISSLSPASAEELKSGGADVQSVPLPRVFGVFFNQSVNPVLANSEVRQALNTAVDRTTIINTVLDGYGIPLAGPIPPVLLPQAGDLEQPPVFSANSITTAKKILTDAGWSLNANGIMEKKTKSSDQVLAFSISTANTSDLEATANLLKQQWQAIGAEVTVKVYSLGDLNQNVIQTRNYDSLLFGETIGRDLDLFSFWDSSQRNDPGLNISLYANSTVDTLLEDARSNPSADERLSDYTSFISHISKDAPAVFLYSPDFIYIIPHDLQGLSLGTITDPSERFLSVDSWYMETDRVWKIFVNH